MQFTLAHTLPFEPFWSCGLGFSLVLGWLKGPAFLMVGFVVSGGRVCCQLEAQMKREDRKGKEMNSPFMMIPLANVTIHILTRGSPQALNCTVDCSF